jgi:hypothetical protein
VEDQEMNQHLQTMQTVANILRDMEELDLMDKETLAYRFELVYQQELQRHLFSLGLLPGDHHLIGTLNKKVGG